MDDVNKREWYVRGNEKKSRGNMKKRENKETRAFLHKQQNKHITGLLHKTGKLKSG